MSRFGDRKKMMRRLGGANGVHGNAHIAIRAVFKTDWTRETGSKLAMDLALCCARANGTPGNQIGEVLGRDHVEEFASCGHSRFVQFEQQTSRQAQPVIDLKTAVEVGFYNQAFAAYREQRILKVNPQQDQ